MKGRRFIPTIVAVLLLVGLVVYLGIRQPPDPEERARLARTVFKLDSKDIDRIEIQNPNGTFTFVRESDDWRLTAPLAVPAEERRINAMRSALGHLTAVAIAWDKATDADRAKVGLASAPTIVKFRAGTEEYEMAIGQLHPTSDEYYVARSDRDSVYTVRKWTLEVFQKDLGEYRRRQMLALDRNDVRSLTIHKRGKKTLAFERSDAKAPWAMRHPLDAPADADVVTTIVSKLVLLRAEDFVPAEDAGDVGKLGLDNPQWTVELGTESGRRTLEFGKDAPTENRVAFPPYYVRVAGTSEVYTTSSPLRRDFALPVREWRDERIARFDLGAVKRIQLTLGDVQSSARKGETWRTDLPRDRFADPQAMALLRHLERLSAKEFVADEPSSLAPYGLETPEITIELTLQDGTTRKVHVGTGPADGRYVKSDEFPTVYKAATKRVLDAAEALHRLATTDELESQDSATIVIDRDPQ